MEQLKVVSLFSGIEGFGLGFERAGAKVVAHVEIDPDCQKVVDRWFTGQAFGDVAGVGAHNLPFADLVCGGFPCQDLSVAGKRAGLAGKRSGLWYKFRRVVAELHPEWVVVENVGGLLSSQSGRDLAVILRGLAELGYWWAYRVFDAQYFGVAQRRERVFIVGHSRERTYPAKVLFEPQSLPGHPAPSRQARQAVAGTLGGGPGERGWAQDTERMTFIPELSYARLAKGNDSQDPSMETYIAHALTRAHDASEDGTGRGVPIVAGTLSPGAHPGGYNGQDSTFIAETLRSHPRPGSATMGAVALVRATRPHGAHYGPLDDERWEEGDVHPTLTPDGATQNSAVVATIGGGNYGAGNLSEGVPNMVQEGLAVRRLTPMECERLQGFPDGWTSGLSDSARYRMLGNAVCVPVAEWAARRIVNLEGNRD